MNRRKSRELALKILFQKEYQSSDVEKVLSCFTSHPKYKDHYSKNQMEFAEELLKGCQNHRKTIDKLIESISKNWTLTRISLIDLNILRIAVFEILHQPDIPRKASINEAVELAKLFGDKNSASFINGILDKVPECITNTG